MGLLIGDPPAVWTTSPTLHGLRQNIKSKFERQKELPERPRAKEIFSWSLGDKEGRTAISGRPRQRAVAQNVTFSRMESKHSVY